LRGPEVPEERESIRERWLEALSVLGVPRAAAVRRSFAIPAPERGIRAAGPRMRAPRPVASVRAQDFQRSQVPLQGMVPRGLGVRRCKADPALFLVAHRKLGLRTFGPAHRLGGEGTVLDARVGIAAIRPAVVPRAAGVVLLFEGAALFLLEWTDAAGQGPWGPVAHAGRPPPSRSVVDRILAQDSCEDWLGAQARRLADSPHALERAAAVGLVGRLWMPSRDSDRRSVVEALMGGAEHPPGRARGLAAGLDSGAWAELEQSAVRAASRLRAAVGRFPDAEFGAAEGVPMQLRRLAHERDDLESVAFVLGVAGGGTVLREVLDEVDREVANRLLGYTLLTVLGDDDRLAAVAWQEPDAWWGALAIPVPPTGGGTGG
jgi:hypothetical protein